MHLRMNSHLNLYNNRFLAVDVVLPVSLVWGVYPHSQSLVQHNVDRDHFLIRRCTIISRAVVDKPCVFLFDSVDNVANPIGRICYSLFFFWLLGIFN